MTDLELVLNMLAEATTTEISKVQKPDTFDKSKTVAQSSGKIAGDARKSIESQTSKPVITSKNAVELGQLVTGLIEDTGNPDKEPE